MNYFFGAHPILLYSVYFDELFSYKVAEHKTKLTLLDYKTQQDKQRKQHNSKA